MRLVFDYILLSQNYATSSIYKVSSYVLTQELATTDKSQWGLNTGNDMRRCNRREQCLYMSAQNEAKLHDNYVYSSLKLSF